MHVVALNAEKAGVVCVIRIWDGVKNPGQTTYFGEPGVDTSGIQTPVLVSAGSLMTAVDALKSGTNVTLEVTIDRNTWVDFFNSVPFVLTFRVIFPAWSFFNVAIAVRRWARFLAGQRQKKKPWHSWNLAMTALALEAGCNLERGVVFALDGVLSTPNLGAIPKQVFATIFLPFSFITTLMIASFWSGAASGMRMPQAQRRRRRVASVAVASLLLLLEVVNILSRVSYNSNPLTLMLAGLVGIALTLAVGIYFLWSGAKLLSVSRSGSKYTAAASTAAATAKTATAAASAAAGGGDGGGAATTTAASPPRMTKFQRSMTRWVMASGGSMLLWLLGCALFTSPAFYTQGGYGAAYLLMLLSYSLTSTTQIMAFKPPPSTKKVTRVAPVGRSGGGAASTSRPMRLQSSTVKSTVNH